MDSSFDVKTQRQFERDRPDMVIFDDNSIIFQENKVSAPFADDQIKRYEDTLKKELAGTTKSGFVVSCAVASYPPGCSK